MQEATLEVLSYDDSLFTNAHDLVAHEAVHDGRGTFTHLGVRMEGLETARHLNFKHERDSASGGFVFYRDHSTVNHVLLGLLSPSTRMLVHELEFDTAFFTRNFTKDVYSVVLVDELEGKEETVVKHLQLEGDSRRKVALDRPVPATKIRLCMGEGGLSRFKVFGEPLAPLPKDEYLLDGARIFGASDASYGDPSLVLREQRQGKVMAGWESCRHSARHRLGLALSKPAIPSKILIDTYMHCLNPFRFFTVLACNSTEGDDQLLESLPPWKVTFPDGSTQLVNDSKLNDFMESNAGMVTACKGPIKYQLVNTNDSQYQGSWRELLPMAPLQRDTLHEFGAEQLKGKSGLGGAVTHLMLLGLPDGGIHRFCVYGKSINQCE